MWLRASLAFACSTLLSFALWAGPAGAAHISPALDVAALWTPLPGSGYLNFMTPQAFIPIAPVGPGAPIPPGGIFYEEHTGWTDAAGVDWRDPVAATTDGDAWAGDRADFDWVQENRPDEIGLTPGGSNHPGSGAMGWDISPTMASPHTTGGAPHGHSVAEVPPGPLPELVLPDYSGTTFNLVDVFSIISTGEDSDTPSPREAALDYELWFVDLVLGVSTPGVPVAVFVPGWTAATTIDDFVARWKPSIPGAWNAVAIDPPGGIPGHDEITEIDAIVAVPEPSTGLLLAASLIGLALGRRALR